MISAFIVSPDLFIDKFFKRNSKRLDIQYSEQRHFFHIEGVRYVSDRDVHKNKSYALESDRFYE